MCHEDRTHEEKLSLYEESSCLRASVAAPRGGGANAVASIVMALPRYGAMIGCSFRCPSAPLSTSAREMRILR